MTTKETVLVHMSLALGCYKQKFLAMKSEVRVVSMLIKSVTPEFDTSRT